MSAGAIPSFEDFKKQQGAAIPSFEEYKAQQGPQPGDSGGRPPNPVMDSLRFLGNEAVGVGKGLISPLTSAYQRVTNPPDYQHTPMDNPADPSANPLVRMGKQAARSIPGLNYGDPLSPEEQGNLAQSAGKVASIPLAGKLIGAAPEMAEAAPMVGRVAGGAVKGGLKNAFAPVATGHGFMGKLPQSMIGAVGGGIAGRELAGEMGGKIGAIAGGAYPIVRGAIEGGKQGLADYNASQGRFPLRNEMPEQLQPIGPVKFNPKPEEPEPQPLAPIPPVRFNPKPSEPAAPKPLGKVPPVKFNPFSKYIGAKPEDVPPIVRQQGNMPEPEPVPRPAPQRTAPIPPVQFPPRTGPGAPPVVQLMRSPPKPAAFRTVKGTGSPMSAPAPAAPPEVSVPFPKIGTTTGNEMAPGSGGEVGAGHTIYNVPIGKLQPAENIAGQAGKMNDARRYGEQMLGGSEPPPLFGTYDKGTGQVKIWSGSRRLMGAQIAKKSTLPVAIPKPPNE